MSSLVEWQPHSPLLAAYAILSRRAAMAERQRYADLREVVNNQIWSQYSLYPEQEAKIVAVMDRIRIRQEGAPMTETTDAEDINMLDDAATLDMSYAQRHSHRFLLKKAWRRVRTMVHPDKSDAAREEFQMLFDSYRAGDINALNEYVISFDKTIVEQIEYWLNEKQKPKIEWAILQRMPMFQIVRALAAGNRELAAQLAFAQRRQRLRELELEELLMGS
jgi:hypothetical protein